MPRNDQQRQAGGGEMRRLLEFYEGHPERWTQKVFARDKHGEKVAITSPDAYCFCLVGAILHLFSHDDLAVHRRMREHVPDGKIAIFNDSSTFNEVLDVIRLAVEQEEAAV
jgi:hypothetical protein